MRATPAVGRIRPSSIRRVVVLPAPFGPRNPATRPDGMSKVRSSTARTPPNCLRSDRTEIAAVMAITVGVAGPGVIAP
jgi:hypothetical protein